MYTWECGAEWVGGSGTFVQVLRGRKRNSLCGSRINFLSHFSLICPLIGTFLHSSVTLLPASVLQVSSFMFSDFLFLPHSFSVITGLCFLPGLSSWVCPITLISQIYTWTSAAVRYSSFASSSSSQINTCGFISSRPTNLFFVFLSQLRSAGAGVIQELFPRVSCVGTLDISDNGKKRLRAVMSKQDMLSSPKLCCPIRWHHIADRCWNG